PCEKHRCFKAINKRCSKDFQAAVDGYCKFWVKITYEETTTFGAYCYLLLFLLHLDMPLLPVFSSTTSTLLLMSQL
ncbi:MAG: hypothetical protein V3V90_02475, partial [Thermodesulfobacteriota bacterium]